MFLKRLLWGVLLLNACAIVEKELENNDTAVKALGGRVLSIPTTIQGNFKNIQDKDYYPIYVKKAGYYSIAVAQAKGFDIKLSLLNNDTKPLVVADDYYKNFGEQIPCLFLKRQLYYVLVESKPQAYPSPRENTNPDYTLIIQPFILNTQDKQFSMDREPTPHIHALQSVYKNVKHFGFFHPTNDSSLSDPLLEDLVEYISSITQKDYKPYKLTLYTFDIPELGNFLLHLQLSGVQDIDSVVAIFDIDSFHSILKEGTVSKNGYRLIIDDNGYNQQEIIEDYKISGGKRYIIALIGTNRLNYKPFLEARKNYYQLLFNLKSIKNNTEQEPNNTLETANILTERKISGKIESRNDMDIFFLNHTAILQNAPQFATTVDQDTSFLADLHLDFTLPNSIKMDILNTKGETIKEISSNSPSGLSLSLPSLFLQSHRPYFIKISPRNYVTKPMTYSLKIDLKNQKQTSKYITEVEPNDSIVTFRKNQDDQYLVYQNAKGLISSPADQDTYFYSVSQETKYRFELSALPKTDLLLIIYNERNHIVFSQKTEKDSPLIFHLPLTPGMYKIIVKSTQKEFYDKENFYNLSIIQAVS